MRKKELFSKILCLKSDAPVAPSTKKAQDIKQDETSGVIVLY